MTRLLQGWITEHAERRPSSTALVMHDEHLSYEQIEARTNQLARMLKAIGCLRGDRVALLMGKSPTAIVAILGILKADCIYVPLDPASPVPRLAHMVASAEPRCILAAGPTAALLDALRAAQQSSRSIAIAWSSTMSMRTAFGGNETSRPAWSRLTTGVSRCGRSARAGARGETSTTTV